MKLTLLLVSADVADIDFYACHETRAAPHLWLYVTDISLYHSRVTIYCSFWVVPLGW